MRVEEANRGNSGSENRLHGDSSTTQQVLSANA